MKVICVNCDPGAPEIDETAYSAHMQSKHSGGQIANIAAKKNVPKKDSLGLPPDILPDDEFLKTVAEMEEAAKTPKPLPPQIATSDSPPKGIDTHKPVAEQIPVTLKYRYDGNCTKCNTPVRTIVLSANGKTIATAYCLTHEVIQQEEVQPLEKKEVNRGKSAV